MVESRDSTRKAADTDRSHSHGELGIWSRLTTLVRFGAVGVAATLTYFMITVVLGRPAIGLEPVAANTIGVAVSLVVSYLGHHSFTFQLRGDHDIYFPRFMIVTAALFALSTAAMAIGRYTLGLDHTTVTGAIAVGYPVASYLLNLLWTFSFRR